MDLARAELAVPLVSLTIRGFRNLEETSLELDPGQNYLFGENGAGKTNLLEAVHVLSTGRSFRRCQDADLLQYGAEVLSVAGSTESGASAEFRFDGLEKRMFRNGARVERLADYFGWLPVVVLLLEDIELVRGAPGVRRAFLDMAAAKTDPKYVTVLNDYRQALLQRSRLFESPADPGLEDVWDEELVRTAVPVYRSRLKTAEGLLKGALGHFRRFGIGDLTAAYRSTVPLDGDIAVAMRRRLAGTRERSRQLRMIFVGPHRDDVVIQRDGRELRRFGSVGEQRLAAIALRLAEADLVSSLAGRPTFLMDEIASELDEKKARLVFDLVAERGQSLYAAARPFPVRGREFRIAQGKVEAIH
ncbi:MAG: DNA replication and repair protein RecF [candidate division WOR-3 bacterium]